MAGTYSKPGDGSVVFKPGDLVEVLNIATGRWELATIVVKGKKGDEIAYQVSYGRGRLFVTTESSIRRHYELGVNSQRETA